MLYWVSEESQQKTSSSNTGCFIQQTAVKFPASSPLFMPILFLQFHFSWSPFSDTRHPNWLLLRSKERVLSVNVDQILPTYSHPRVLWLMHLRPLERTFFEPWDLWAQSSILLTANKYLGLSQSLSGLPSHSHGDLLDKFRFHLEMPWPRYHPICSLGDTVPRYLKGREGLLLAFEVHWRPLSKGNGENHSCFCTSLLFDRQEHLWLP